MADVVTVEIFQLGKIKPCRRFPDIAEIKPFNQLRRGKNLLVAMAPSQPRQVIAQGRGQITQGAVGLDPQRPVALGKLGAIPTVNERHMSHIRHRPIHGQIDLRLPRRVGEMINPADNMGHPHVVVINHDGKIIGGVAIGAQDDQIIQVPVGQHHTALGIVSDDGFAFLR